MTFNQSVIIYSWVLFLENRMNALCAANSDDWIGVFDIVAYHLGQMESDLYDKAKEHIRVKSILN